MSVNEYITKLFLGYLLYLVIYFIFRIHFGIHKNGYEESKKALICGAFLFFDFGF